MQNNLLDINIIRMFVDQGKIEWTKHCLNRMQQRNITIQDFKYAIKNGKIIEYYQNDYPYPSCLILGYNQKNQVIHLVCGINKDKAYMVTAYYPNKNKWKDDNKTRRNI